MSKGKRFFQSLLQVLKNFVTKNLHLKIIAIIFAALLWGYILADINPEQPKTVSDVKITLDGTNDLMTRHLIVVDSETGTARVTVNSNINNHSSLTAARINCVASVATINEAGTYQLTLDATVQNDMGTVSQVSPSSITVEVDNLISKTVPVRLVLEGEVEEGYEIISRTIANSITIEGAERYIDPVAWAVATVNIEGMNEDYESAVNVEFYNEAGEVLDVITRTGDNPSVVVQLTVLAVKENVPIKLVMSEYDEKYLEVVTSMPYSTIDLLGDKEVLNAIESIETTEIPITEDMIGTTVTESFTLNLPDGVQLRTGQLRTIRVTIVVKDAEDEMEFEVPITIEGLDKDLEVGADTPTFITILVRGKVRDLEQTTSGDFEAIADLSGLAAGTHELIVAANYIGKLEDDALVLVRDSQRCTYTLITIIE
ncbi:MAG: CdaR family protein [Clostridia bacterium]|nr:CdaR family protein [Clostridia bacterium]